MYPPQMQQPGGANPYGGKGGAPIQRSSLSIKPDDRRCYRRKNWVEEEGKDWIEILQEDRSCMCTWAYPTRYQIKVGENVVGNMEEVSNCASKFFCPIQSRCMESHLTLNGRKTIAEKPFVVGYMPGCSALTCCDSCLPQMRVRDANGSPIGFIVTKWYHNCNMVATLDCYKGSERSPANFLFTVSERNCIIMPDCNKYMCDPCANCLCCFFKCELNCLSPCWWRKKWWTFGDQYNCLCNTSQEKDYPKLW